MKTMSFTATGDSFITRRLPSTTDKEFLKVKEILHKGQFRFTNLEVVVRENEGFPAKESGGTWASTTPDRLRDIANYGFNAIAWANNHTLDYSYGGLEATKEALDDLYFVHAGVGNNLAEASAPKYLDCPNGRVALIAATSTYPSSWEAGEQRPDMKGRPGINPLRYKTKHIVTEEQMKVLKEIADSTTINAMTNLDIKEGFRLPSSDGTFLFGDQIFAIGSETMSKEVLNEGDMKRIIRRIEEAKRQADYVVVSIHSHELEGEEKNRPALFLKEFARSCIDAGAHAIIGHGPHILRGIEIYKGRPIFYSLGNFIFQNSTVAALPQDFYENYSLSYEHTVADALDRRSQNGRIGLGANPFVWESVIPHWKMENGELTELVLYPIELGFGQPRFRKGWPKLTSNRKVLENIKQLSEPFDTQIVIEDTVGKVLI